MRTLEEVVTDIISTHQELGFVKQEKLRKWRDVYIASTDPTVTGRSREADIGATDVECEVVALDHQLQALVEEKFMVIRCMDIGVSV